MPEAVMAAICELEAGGGIALKVNCFYNPAYPGTTTSDRERIAGALSAMPGAIAPPITFIAQAPADGAPYALELSVLEPRAGKPEVCFRSTGPLTYTLLSDGDKRWLFLGIDDRHVKASDFQAMVHRCFSMADDILRSENMDFRNVLRQWNYIENITATVRDDSGEYQYYQTFNDIRALFYEKSGLRGDYPAATGIGCDGGGFALELVAASDAGSLQRVSIKSPVQKNAYDYSAGVLVGQALHPLAKQAPLFERAKMMLYRDNALVFVSGTAAISGETSANVPDPVYQTEATIRNIFELLSAENLLKNGVETQFEPFNPSAIRVYIKHPDHFAEVTACCRSHFPDTPILLLHAGVCRDELLVEIEAVFESRVLQRPRPAAAIPLSENLAIL